eukprot:CAMPEP_0194522572 /NCGR_PEP_ID=MMETSP0253-20130528/57188_1 /TAXON_ID=2966 /ORGANISM="Noctiluca scintillans" /LENGTH=252 /DNA_ID=CAMNT_0039367025 /DNA_START=31 /DNA_END=790 /DNA_ORIENTATION=-
MHLGKFPHGNLGKSASETSLGGISIASDTTGKPAMAPPRSTTGMLLSEQPHYPGKPDALGRLPLPPPSQVQGMYSYQGQQLRSPLSSIHALGPKGRGGYAYVNTDSQAFHTPAPNWVVEEVIDFGLPDDWGVREMHEPEFGVGCDMATAASRNDNLASSPTVLLLCVTTEDLRRLSTARREVPGDDMVVLLTPVMEASRHMHEMALQTPESIRLCTAIARNRCPALASPVLCASVPFQWRVEFRFQGYFSTP